MARKSLVLNIIDWAVLFLTIGATTALVCTYVAPSVNPNRIWVFAYTGLAAPVIYMANLFLMLYWAIRWRPVFFLSLFVLLIGVSKINDYYHGGGEKQVEIEESGTFKVLTYNVEGFIQHEGGKRVSSARQIAQFIKENDPDIVCLQEFQATPATPQAVIDTLLGNWKYNKIYYTTRNYGSAVYSKFPISNSGVLPLAGDRKGVLWVDVLAAGDTVRVVCNHLETTGIRDNDLAFLQPGNFAESPNRSGHIRTIAGRLRRGFRTRAMQADTIASFIGTYNGLAIICGDFNDPPMSYTYRKIRGDFRDAFEDEGHGYGYTYKKLYRLLRIDYILPSPHFETLYYDSPDVPWSDHNPVIAILRKKK